MKQCRNAIVQSTTESSNDCSTKMNDNVLLMPTVPWHTRSLSWRALLTNTVVISNFSHQCAHGDSTPSPLTKSKFTIFSKASCCHLLEVWKLNFPVPSFLALLRILERFPVNFCESKFISNWDFRIHWSMAGRGTPRQLRPTCPHITRTLSTTHHSFHTPLHTHLFAFKLVIELAQVDSSCGLQGSQGSALLQESSPWSCIGQLGTVVVTIQSIFVHLP